MPMGRLFQKLPSKEWLVPRSYEAPKRLEKTNYLSPFSLAPCCSSARDPEMPPAQFVPMHFPAEPGGAFHLPSSQVTCWLPAATSLKVGVVFGVSGFRCYQTASFDTLNPAS